MNASATVLFLRFFVVDVLFDVVRFPIWWYTSGLVRTLRWYGNQLRYGVDRLALVVLAKNLSRPMFGDYTREGRLISFAVRIVQLLVSFVLYLGWVIIMTALLVAYGALPVAVVALVIYVWPNG